MDTSRCVRCDKPCGTTAMLCESCRVLLEEKRALKEPQIEHDIADIGTAPVVALVPDTQDEYVREHTDALALSSMVDTPTEPQKALLPAPGYVDPVEQTLRLLNEAAQRIEAFEQRPRRRPRVPRLSYYRDISSEIQRESTPMPLLSKTDELERRLVDIWPWLADESEVEEDEWSNHTDPLAARHLPGSVLRAPARKRKSYSIVPFPFPAAISPILVRAVLLALIFLAVLGLIVDGTLLSWSFSHPQHRKAALVNTPPTLVLSANKVIYGQLVHLRILHFSASTSVYLTRDIGEKIKTNIGSSPIRMGSNGSREVSILVDGAWNPGFHAIEAEDVLTRYTASATLQVISGPTRPSHLLVSTGMLDFGADVQGTNTLRTLVLHNGGGGAIAWSASSNQPWLLVTPAQGLFSDSQTVAVGVQRTNLSPGSYTGTITVSSDVGGTEQVQVQMEVGTLPADQGAALSVTPVVLAFTAPDGAPDASPQYLQMSNPGSQSLSWSLASNTADQLPTQAPPATTNWLSLDQTAGTLAPGATALLRVHAHSQNLLPGAYMNTLLFNVGGANSVAETSQNVAVSLTVQPHCGIKAGNGLLSFTAVPGQGNPSNQSLTLETTTSCSGTIAWQAASSANWLTITPANGQLASGADTMLTAGVNSSGLKPGTYSATLSIVAGAMSQAVIVQLVVQAPPPPVAPVMAVAPLNVSFSTTLGQNNPPGQAVTITNPGRSALVWRTATSALAPFWLGAWPSGGTIPPGGSAQLTVNVNASNLTPGTYSGQIVLDGTDANNVGAAGSPQTVGVTFTVLAPCTLAQLSSSSLAFNVPQGNLNVSPQSMNLTATGNCSWPLKWQARVTGTAPWLNLSSRAGSFSDSNQSVMLSVSPSVAGLNPGNYSAQVTITATDAAGLTAQGSSQSFSVLLTITQPCTLQVPSTLLSFAIGHGKVTTNTQSLNVNEVGSCARPVSWTATANSGSSAWLSLSQASGKDSGTISVSVNTTGLAAGTYHGTITITATASDGSAVQGSPVVVPVSLVVP